MLRVDADRAAYGSKPVFLCMERFAIQVRRRLIGVFVGFTHLALSYIFSVVCSNNRGLNLLPADVADFRCALPIAQYRHAAEIRGTCGGAIFCNFHHLCVPTVLFLHDLRWCWLYSTLAFYIIIAEC
jgi:hypothetical protein